MIHFYGPIYNVPSRYVTKAYITHVPDRNVTLIYWDHMQLEPSGAVPLRERVLSELNPKQRAMYRFLENLRQFVISAQMPDGQSMEVQWDNGRTTQQLLERVNAGDTSSLPCPTPTRYESFCWMVNVSRDARKRMGWQAAQAAELGASDLRICEVNRNGQPTIEFIANQGKRLKGTETWWNTVTAAIDYPMAARDDDGFVYRNPRHTNLPEGSVS